MLFVGDDWAEGHHDIEVQDVAGHTLAQAKLEEVSTVFAGCTR